MNRVMFCLVMLPLMAHAGPIPTNTAVYVPGTHNGKVYYSILSKADVDVMPPWHHERDERPPVSPMQAKASAQRVLESLIPPEELKKQWQLTSITVALATPAAAKDPKWYYLVRWRGPRVGVKRRKVDGRLHLRDVYDKFALIVMMNGKCVQPREEAPNKALEETSDSARSAKPEAPQG